MTGYTALMQQNELLAMQKRMRLKEVLESTIQQHSGKILQYYGDGSLSIFNSAIDGANCAIKIQQQLLQEPKVDIRIGLHTGDVIIDDEAIFGDGVNVASRIESLALPGSVFISDKLYDEIKNQADILTHEMGFFELKNVKQPVRVYALANEGIIVPDRRDVRGKTTQPNNRLAVLPFVNMSADPENEFFSDGITEELLNALTKVDGLQVTSRTSAFAFKGKNHDIRDIGIQLNVDKVLEGSVRKAGNRVRITSQLINAADGYHIWSDTYDRDLTDIFEVQDEISGIIANKLRENLSLNQHQHLFKTPTENIEAYTFYLKALHFWNKMTPGDARKCIENCEKAIDLEEKYAQPYALTAWAHAFLGASGQMLPNQAFAIVHKYADKALALNPDIAESHIAKASAYLFYDWKWEMAFEELQKAVKLNPGISDSYELLGFYHIIKGEKEKALALLEEAARRDPLSPIILQALGNNYIFSERYDDAITQANKLLEVHPKMRTTIEMKGWAYGMKGDWETALGLFEEVHRLTNHPLKGLMGLGVAYGRLGMKEKALEIITKLEQRQREETESVIDADLASVWYGLENLDKTFYHINRCIDQRMGPVSYFLEYPAFEELKKDPRYYELKKRMGLYPV